MNVRIEFYKAIDADSETLGERIIELRELSSKLLDLYKTGGQPGYIMSENEYIDIFRTDKDKRPGFQ